MKKNLRYIYLAFSVSLLITISISYLLLKNLHTLRVHNEAIDHAQKVLDKIENVQYLLLYAENSQRGFIITLDSSFLQDLSRTQKLIKPEIDSLRQLTKNTESQRQALIKLNYTVYNRFQVLNQTIDQVLAGDNSLFYQNDLKGKKIMADFNSLASKMEEVELANLMQKEKQKESYERATPNYLYLVLMASIVFQVLSFILIVSEFRRRYRYQKELEKKINELNMSRGELEQIAFIASHDLQEPLRKMRTFGGRLLMLFKDKLNDEGNMMLERLDVAAQRMQGLIGDLVDYTNLINSEEPAERIDLNECVNDIKKNLANLIASKKAIIHSDELPAINGYAFQLQLLFTNLIHNAIKFSKKGVRPEIWITAEERIATNIYASEHGIKDEPYLVIKVRDNGIGFENEFAKKIFVMFQRLHNQQSNYDGKGIGLSICKRVMTNHNGFISAEGEPEVGATFNLYFPLNN